MKKTNKIQMHKKNFQKGQILPALLILAFVVFLLIRGISGTFTSTTKAETCVENPDPDFFATYNGNNYYRIKKVTGIPSAELPSHLRKIGVVESTNGTKEGYVPTLNEEGHTITSNWDDAAADLLFLDVTPDITDKVKGYSYFEIFLKENANMPNFIIEFCNLSNQPLAPKTLLPDASGYTFPPYSFNSSDITDQVNNDPCPPGTNYGWPDCHLVFPENTIYYLFSFEGLESKSSESTILPGNPTGILRIRSGIQEKVYKVYFSDWSFISYMALLDTDTSNPDSKIYYKYVTSKFLTPFSNLITPVPSAPYQTLQLKAFEFTKIMPWGWWSPECKPAVYLYPEKETKVNVKVSPKGYLTYTDPLYPKDGWNVTAYPNGTLNSKNKNYDYLYYESKILDSAINIPKEGFVVEFNKLVNFYDQILPELGLNSKEIKDFKEYWQGILPEARYYFVGIMDETSIEKIEPLTIDPKPMTIIRVRLYFKPLEEKIRVEEPEIITPKRDGFTAVEWGGIVKTDKEHPFSCSQ